MQNQSVTTARDQQTFENVNKQDIDDSIDETQAVQQDLTDEYGNICIVPGTCKLTYRCVNCSYTYNVTDSTNTHNSNHIIRAINATNTNYSSDLVNTSDTVFCNKCSNTKNVTNCSNINTGTDLFNCTDCQNAVNVTNALDVSDVQHSLYVEHLSSSSNCYQVYNTSNCFTCTNVTNSHFCSNCKRCVECQDCQRCIGYKCKGAEDCRNPYWRWTYWEPADSNDKAWNCSNPINTKYRFNQDGYKAPTYLDKPVINSDPLTFCLAWNKNKSCCSPQTTKEIKEIFLHYKATLELRSKEKIKELKSLFEKYKDINYNNVPNSLIIRNNIIDELRNTKKWIYEIAKDMGTCGKSVLHYVAGILCLGCLPDWRWQRYIPMNISYGSDKEFFDFDPDAARTEAESTIDITKILAQQVQISKPMCDEMLNQCQPLMARFDRFRNDSALAIGRFNEAITKGQRSSQQENQRDYKVQLATEIGTIVDRQLVFIGREDDPDMPDPDVEPEQDEKSVRTLEVERFIHSLSDLGREYPFDPVIYFNFHPSINFDDPIYMNDDMCKAMAKTSRIPFNWVDSTHDCKFCTNHDSDQDKVNAWKALVESERPECIKQEYDPIWYELDEETNKQYREFSVYFFQVRAIYAEYHDTETEDYFVRHVLFPPFREMELYMMIKENSFAQKKEFYAYLESNVTQQYIRFKNEKEKQDEFVIWNDEYWMFFIYQQVLSQGKSQFEYLYALNQKQTEPFTSYIFKCDYDGNCTICNYYDKTQCIANKNNTEKYISQCDDCHYSKVKLQSTCIEQTCISCLYIGGDPDDLDEDGQVNEPMEKCFIKSFKPYFDLNANDGIFYPEFHREMADPEEYRDMEAEFDLQCLKHNKINIATTAEWFYQRPSTIQFSVNNVMRLYNLTSTFQVPDMAEALKYKYVIPCELKHIVHECSSWLCDDLTRSFFPRKRIVYDPQIKYDSAYENIVAPSDSGIYSDQLINDTLAKNPATDAEYKGNLAWNMYFRTPNFDENDTFYDITYWGKVMGTEEDYKLEIDGITIDTELDPVVKSEEPYVYGYLIQCVKELAIFITLFVMFMF